MHDRFEFARSRIIQEQRFFAVLMMSRKWEEFDNPRAAMATDGESIFYNIKGCSTFTQKELQGVVIHELFHIFGKHHLRMGNRDQETWSMACDYAINPPLIKMGVELPPTKFIRADFDSKSAEEIYNILMKEKEDDKGSGGYQSTRPHTVGSGSAVYRDDGLPWC